MTSFSTAAQDAKARAEQSSTRIAFFIAGFSVASWAPLVPYVKQRMGLDEGTLGLLLLCLGVGSIISMPLAGALAARRRLLVCSTLLICLCLPLLATISSLPLLIATLFLFGASMGGVDCTANVQAVIVERNSGKTMMSGFHGLFSLGGIVGAAGVAGLLSLGISPFYSMLVVVVLTLIAWPSCAEPVAVRQPIGWAGLCGPAWRGAVYRSAVFHGFSGRRCDARLERGVPHLVARR